MSVVNKLETSFVVWWF